MDARNKCGHDDRSVHRLHHRHLLQVDRLAHTLLGERQEFQQLLLGERDLLRRALHLDDVARRSAKLASVSAAGPP